jgi:phosphoglycolate phosphatase-like HAD superfamily hydrolase
VAVTTNNSADAAASYLRLCGLTDCFGGRVHGRPADPRLMKPDPACVLAALESTQAEPSACLLIGDSPHDYEAARAVHVPFLGYAKDAGEEEELRGAGASHIVRSLALVYEAVVPA